MRQQRERSRRTAAEGRQPPQVLADPVASARVLAETLPQAVDRAEAAGLSIIARHLSKGLDLARRIVATSEARQERAGGGH